MDSDKLEIFNIHSDEFKFLDYPNTFLSNNLEDEDLNKSANTQLEENLKELMKITEEYSKQHQQTNGKIDFKNNYLDDLKDLKELKRIEDKKSYQQSLDRLSKLSLNNHHFSNQHLAGLYSTDQNLGISNDDLNGKRFTTYKTEPKHLRTFRSNNHLATPINYDQTLDTTFNLADVDCNKTFAMSSNNVNCELLNFSPEKQQDAENLNDADNTFTVLKNYDEVQEIARKREEALKKNQNTTMQFAPATPPAHNATMIKMKKNGLHKFENTITLKHLINENLNDYIKSPNLDGTFNLGNPMETTITLNGPMSNQQFNNGTIKKEKLTMPNQIQHRNSFVLTQKNATNLKKVLNNRNNNLESKNNRLNSSFIVSEPTTLLQQPTATAHEDKNPNSTFKLMPNSPNQFSTITKNKINKNLKRTNTFKVREFQYASEENLTTNLTFSKNGNNLLNPGFVRNGLSVNNYQSIDDMKNYDTIKLSQRKVNKLTSSKSNSNITSSKTLFNLESNENLNDIYKPDSKFPAFASRLKAPSSRMSLLKSEEI